MPELGLFTHFRYEYVSGVFSLFELKGENNVEIFVTNRGAVEAFASAFLIQGNVTKLAGSQETVPPGGAKELMTYSPSQAGDFGQYWARIFTSSIDLVPSMRVWATQVENEPPILAPYFAPGDFAVFELPGILLPPGPIGNRV